MLVKDINENISTVRPRLQRYEQLAPAVRPYGSHDNCNVLASAVGEALWYREVEPFQGDATI